MIRNYFKIAWRTFRKNRLFSTVNILGLTAGLASCMLISIYLIDEYSYDLHHEDVDQLYQVATVLKRTDGDITTGSTPYGLADLLINEYSEIEQTTRMVGLFVDDKTLLSYTEGDNTNTFYETKGYLTDKSFFDLFNYDFVQGNAEMALDKPNSIVLSEEIANRIFGKQSALNKTLKVESNTNGSGEYIVTGVFKPSGHPTHHDGRFFMSFEGGALHQYTKNNPGLAGNNFMFTYIKLKESASADALESKFPAFVQKYMAEELSKAGFSKEQFLLPVKDIHLDSGMESNVTPTGDKTQLFVLFSIAIFILLIACINYMNLSTARSSKRAAEVGVRKVLGASKNGLVKQFLSESILMAVLSFLLAVVIVLALWQPFETISGKNFTFSLSQLFGLGGLFIAVSLIAGILAGSYPAFFLSSFRPVKVLKGRVSNSLAAISLRKVLVVFQFTIAIVLIVASVVIFNQMSFLSTKDLGFAKTHRIVVPLRTQDAKKSYSILKDKLENSIHVEAVGAAAYYPGIFNPEDAVFYTEGSNMDLGKHLFINRIDDEFLKTLNIDLVAGRGFSEKFADSSTIIVNQTAIKEFGFPNEEAAIGKSIFTEIQGNLYSREIVGVVKDFHFQDLRSPITPFAFTSEDNNYNYLIANINGKNVDEALRTLEGVWNSANTGLPFEFTFLQEDFQKNYEGERRLSAIVGYFTIVAILISCLGLFGLISFSSDQRKKEIGVRKVLGASVGNIVKTLSVEFMVLVGIALLLAIPLSWWAMSSWLQEFAYSVNLGWWMFGIAGVIAIIIAFATVSGQAFKAAISNPVKSLRTE